MLMSYPVIVADLLCGVRVEWTESERWLVRLEGIGNRDLGSDR